MKKQNNNAVQDKVDMQALKQSEARFRSIVLWSPDAIIVTDAKGKIEYMNPAAEKVFNHKVESFIGTDFGLPLVNGETTEMDIFRPGKDPGVGDMHVVETEWLGEKAHLITIRDITERKQAEELIRQSEEKHRVIINNIEDGYYEVDLNGNFTFFNDSMCEILGYSKVELMGMNNRRITDKENAKIVFQAFNKVYNTGEPTKEFDWQLIKKDGTKGYIEQSASLIKDSSGKPTGFRGIIHDITDRKLAEAKLLETLDSLKKAVDTTMQVMVSVIEIRDPYTAGHHIRSADLASAIATEMGLDQDKVEGIRMAGSIHDIGKLSVPAEILSKPTKLTKLEFSMIKEHSQSGYELLKDVASPWQLAQVAYQHHERMDGSGYPRNLKGDEILLEARIMAVADVVEAMASHRPYRPALGIEAALEEIEKNKGILYDTVVTDACLKLFREKGYALILKKRADGSS